MRRSIYSAGGPSAQRGGQRDRSAMAGETASSGGRRTHRPAGTPLRAPAFPTISFPPSMMLKVLLCDEEISCRSPCALFFVPLFTSLAKGWGWGGEVHLTLTGRACSPFLAVIVLLCCNAASTGGEISRKVGRLWFRVLYAHSSLSILDGGRLADSPLVLVPRPCDVSCVD